MEAVFNLMHRKLTMNQTSALFPSLRPCYSLALVKYRPCYSLALLFPCPGELQALLFPCPGEVQSLLFPCPAIPLPW